MKYTDEAQRLVVPVEVSVVSAPPVTLTAVVNG